MESQKKYLSLGMLTLLPFMRHIYIYMSPEELGEDELININEVSSCKEKNEDNLGARENLVLKTLEIFHDIESIKDKMLVADPNLGI